VTGCAAAGDFRHTHIRSVSPITVVIGPGPGPACHSECSRRCTVTAARAWARSAEGFKFACLAPGPPPAGPYRRYI
jgi:hypothetical protein